MVKTAGKTFGVRQVKRRPGGQKIDHDCRLGGCLQSRHQTILKNIWYFAHPWQKKQTKNEMGWRIRLPSKIKLILYRLAANFLHHFKHRTHRFRIKRHRENGPAVPPGTNDACLATECVAHLLPLRRWDARRRHPRCRRCRSSRLLKIYPRWSMYGIFTYIWVIYKVNVGKYSIHGSSGYWL